MVEENEEYEQAMREICTEKYGKTYSRLQVQYTALPLIGVYKLLKEFYEEEALEAYFG